MKKKNASVWADAHLTGLSISAFEDLYLWYIATEHERTWKQNERKWMQNERKWMQHERSMVGNECKMKGDERKWKQTMTSVDSRPRMLSHPQKAGKLTLLVYRELTTWENDKRCKNSRNVIVGHLKRYRVLIQPHMRIQKWSCKDTVDKWTWYERLVSCFNGVLTTRDTK